MALNDENGYWGDREAAAGTDEYNALLFTVRQILANCNSVALVKVIAAESNGEFAQAGTVDVQPMVNQLDGQGNSVPHGVVNGLIYLRLQGGANAIIMDPQPDDIGIAVFADRDISSVKATRGIANPGSARRYDMADGVYLGGVLNGDPTQYVRFSPEGIDLVSPSLVKIDAPDVQIQCETLEINASDSISATSPNMTFTASTKVRFVTPLVEMTGAATVAGLASLNGGFAALPKSGGGASTIASDVSITGATTTTGTLSNNGKAVGSTHTHQAQGATAVTTAPL